MIEHYIQRLIALQRFQGNPLGKDLEDFTAFLVERGHTANTIYQYLRTAAHFGRWLGQEGIDPALITEHTAESFLYNHLSECKCKSHGMLLLKDARTVLMHLFNILIKNGHITASSPTPPTPIDQEIQRFAEHMRTNCALSEESIRMKSSYAKKFLKTWTPQRQLDFKHLTVQDIIKFVSNSSRNYKPNTTKILARSLRSYLRFLFFRGDINQDLSISVPTVGIWKQGSIPKTLTDEKIKKFFSAFNRATPKGRRDYAICLCLYELGLRRKEVSCLCIDDIDWREGTLRISGTKTHRCRVLPLSDKLGSAIVDYLRNGRPKSTDRHIFLRHYPPIGFPIESGNVTHVVRGVVHRAALDPKQFSPHVFRHTCATRMYEKGAAFKEIADVLGHRSIGTVSIYTKVNLVQLSKVALPWPEVKP